MLSHLKSNLKFGINTRRSTKVVAIIILSVFIFTKCTENNKDKNNSVHKDQFGQFAGSAKCAGCHKNIYDTHIKTEHFLSSAIVGNNNILGSFEKGQNRIAFGPEVYVAMEKRDSGFFQVEYINDEEERNGRFDIVVGSGRKGQSYLSWVGNRLVQMPITFFTPARQWSTSPGYPADKVVYNRQITSRCMECHSTYLDKISAPKTEPEEFDHKRIIYGIDCEKCHGPAAMHVDYQLQNPQNKIAKYIINPGKLSRQQNLDLCALCHGGRMAKLKPSFQFRVGDTLANYFAMNKNKVDAVNIDVHGNQLPLLAASKCFMMSQLTCNNCHNTHENEKDKLAVFSQRCMSCHSDGHEKQCKLTATLGNTITQNCIDCHMPKQPSKTIAVNLPGRDTLTPVMMRTHLIKIYPAATDKFLKSFRKMKFTNSKT